MPDDDLHRSLDALILALRAHADLVVGLAGREDDEAFEAGFAAGETLQAAADAYHAAVEARDGYLPALFEPRLLAGEDALRLSVEARWDFVVRDEAALVAHARERFLAEAAARTGEPDAGAGDVDDHVFDAASALHALFELDAADFGEAYAGYGLEPGGSGETCGEIDRTLWEMPEGQREAEGF